MAARDMPVSSLRHTSVADGELTSECLADDAFSQRADGAGLRASLDLGAARRRTDSCDCSASGSMETARRLPRAVCIDDDLDFITILARHLKRLGMAVVGASNAVLGMRAIVRERPDIVITDYYMPNAFGTYLLRRLQQDDTGLNVPVIVVTGRDLLAQVHPSRSTTLEQELRRLGANSILRKPLNHHALAAAVAKCLSFPGRPRQSHDDG